MEALPMLGMFYIIPTCIVHVGANDGQEVESYRQSGAERVIYIEPIPTVFERLSAKIASIPGHEAYNVLCTAKDGENVEFNIASNNGESSSILGLGNHAILFPDIEYTQKLNLVSTTIDTLKRDKIGDQEISMLVLDVQGAELIVLQGAKQTLASVQSIYCEVSDIDLYGGGCTWQQIVAFLAPFGFKMKDMRIYTKHYGNAFFVKDDKTLGASIETRGTNVALNKVATQSSFSPWSLPDEAGRAVNGHRTGRFAFHTDREHNPWWQVDLGDSYAINEILIFNRMDNCSYRAYSLKVMVGSTPDRLQEIHSQGGRVFGGLDGHPMRISLQGRKARYVKLQLPVDEALHLDQVEVYSDCG